MLKASYCDHSRIDWRLKKNHQLLQPFGKWDQNVLFWRDHIKRLTLSSKLQINNHNQEPYLIVTNRYSIDRIVLSL